MERTPLAVRLGDFVAALTFDALPPAVVDKAKALVNHAVTVGLAGAASARSAARAPRCGWTARAPRGSAPRSRTP